METGLSQNYFRGYDAQTGRYVQGDPIGLEGGVNFYSYASNNSTGAVDFYGLKEYPDDFMGPLPPDGYHAKEMTVTKCGKIPPAPDGVYVSLNVFEAKKRVDPWWFYNMVRNKGPWDYKQQDPKYQDFGNFNYGATASAIGVFPEITIYSEAGRAQLKAKTSRPEWGVPGPRVFPWSGTGTFGDDPDDREQIKKGIEYCKVTAP